MTGIEKAIQAAGSEVALAELLGISQQAVNKMKKRGYCSADRAAQIAQHFRLEARDLIDPALVQIIG